jgi:glyoxylase-like metal-dependent hydrolase (beta-lactamase superfamily II)
MREIVPGITTWSVFSEPSGLDFNGYAIATGSGAILVDPPEPGPDGWEALAALSPSVVYVTNRNHSRAAAAFRDRFSIPVRVHEADIEAAEVDADDAAVEGPIGDGDVTAIHVPGKSPGELAFHVPARRALVVGDVVICPPGAGLTTYPDEAIDDRDELLRSARKLSQLDFDALLLCDGEPVVNGGKERLLEFVDASGLD